MCSFTNVHLAWSLAARQDYRTLFQPVKFKQNSSGSQAASGQAILFLTERDHFNWQETLPSLLSCLSLLLPWTQKQCQEKKSCTMRTKTIYYGWWSKILEWAWIFEEVLEEPHGHYAACLILLIIGEKPSPIWLSCYNPFSATCNWIPF